MPSLNYLSKNKIPLLVAVVFIINLAAIQFIFNANIDMSLWRAKRTLFTVIGTSLILAAPLFFQKHVIGYAVIITTLLNALALGNSIYARYFHAALSSKLLQQTKNLRGLQSSIVSLCKPIDAIFFISILISLAIAYIFNSYLKKQNPKKNLPYLGISLLTLGILLHTVVHVKNFIVYNRNPFLLNFDSLENAAVFTLPFYHIIEAASASSKNIILTPTDKTNIENWFAEQQQLQKIAPEWLPFFGAAQGANLLLIQVEALENSVLNLSIKGREVTPNLNNLLSNSIYFNNIHTQVAFGNTSDAELAALASLYPLTTESTFFAFPNNKYNALPHILQQYSYKTFALHGNSASFWNRGLVWPNLGFTSFFDKEYILNNSNFSPKILGMGIDDNDTFKFALNNINQTIAPWFTFIVTLSSHMPYVLPNIEPWQSDITGTLGNYINAIHYTDAALGVFVQQIRQKHPNTLIAIYGDHEGITGDNKTQAALLKLPTFSSNLGKIPLIISLPNNKSATITRIGGQTDILPTLAFLLGIPSVKYKNSAMGINLFSPTPNAIITPLKHFTGSEYQDFFNNALDISEKLIRSQND